MTSLEAAAYWLVRQDAQRMTTQDWHAFDNWLEASETHRCAYEQTESMWKDLEASVDEGELRALRVTALAAGPAPKVWPRAAAVAAGLVVGILGIAAMSWRLSIDVRTVESSEPRAAVDQYVTAHNQRSTITLPDGTLVSMNVDTSFSTDFTVGRRSIRLSRGQAFFEVAKDSKRPFVVAAADRNIQALGTKFDVKLDRDRVEVVLLEGRVSVARSNPSPLEKVTRRSAPVELAPDQRLVVARGEATTSVTTTNAKEATSWREGWIVFEDETVEQAIAELNRYSERPILAPDEAVRRMRLGGVFRIGQPDRFGDILQELLPLTAERGPNGEMVLVLRAGAAAPHP